MYKRFIAAALAACMVLLPACGKEDTGGLTSTGSSILEGYSEESPETEAESGSSFYSGLTEGYGSDELEDMLEDAVAAADLYCGLVYNYDASDGETISGFNSILSSLEGAFDENDIEDINTVMSGSHVVSSYNGFEPYSMYLQGSGDGYSESVVVYGIADIHFSSDMVEENDYDLYVKFVAAEENGEWKLYQIHAERLFEQGTLYFKDGEGSSYTVCGNLVEQIDFEDPEGYLTDYTYGVSDEEWEEMTKDAVDWEDYINGATE